MITASLGRLDPITVTFGPATGKFGDQTFGGVFDDRRQFRMALPHCLGTAADLTRNLLPFDCAGVDLVDEEAPDQFEGQGRLRAGLGTHPAFSFPSEAGGTLVELVDELQAAEETYRYAHDHLGAGNTQTGRAWDLMRRAGDRARTALGK